MNNLSVTCGGLDATQSGIGECRLSGNQDRARFVSTPQVVETSVGGFGFGVTWIGVQGQLLAP